MGNVVDSEQTGRVANRDTGHCMKIKGFIINILIRHVMEDITNIHKLRIAR
jgi:hypothetical protein